MSYASAYIEDCLAKNHRFRCTLSDKTPMRVSLMCLTCTEQSHDNVYVAYGDDTKSIGVWLSRRKEVEAI